MTRHFEEESPYTNKEIREMFTKDCYLRGYTVKKVMASLMLEFIDQLQYKFHRLTPDKQYKRVPICKKTFKQIKAEMLSTKPNNIY